MKYMYHEKDITTQIEKMSFDSTFPFETDISLFLSYYTYPSGTPKLSPCCCRVRVSQSSVFYVVIFYYCFLFLLFLTYEFACLICIFHHFFKNPVARMLFSPKNCLNTAMKKDDY